MKRQPHPIMADLIDWEKVDLTASWPTCPICDRRFTTRGGMVCRARDNHADDLVSIAEACSALADPPRGRGEGDVT